ncbi:hypothetical protein J437_LFUL014409 [Ladona fulva]|uniref:Copper homeostasis protein cutC homolog n=1 Tax=Ladona fulva TaxID=123851 RepID=A0A8K0K4F9_LADFU|nr:hypothetical protein J437_LFUL014409 [Ladona fulva]
MEVCVDCVESAVNAGKGGASRIELCSALSEGGLTPTVGLLRRVKSLVKIPVFVMIRPRRGDFCYSNDEVEVLYEDIRLLKDNSADGFVFGSLTPEGAIDRAICEKLISLASPLPCTFHRAFDLACDPIQSLDTIIEIGFHRLLTSGQAKSAESGAMLIKKLIDQANGKISIMPGAGITAENLEKILILTCAREFHASARKAVQSKMIHVNETCKMGGKCDEYELLVTDVYTVKTMVETAQSVWNSHN